MQVILAVSDLERSLAFWESAFDSVDDVEAAVARVEAAGGRPLSPPGPREWGETAAWFADADGNVIAVAGPAPA